MRWLRALTVRHATAVAVFGSLLLHAALLCVLALSGAASLAAAQQVAQRGLQPTIEVALLEAPVAQPSVTSTEHVLGRASAIQQVMRGPVQSNYQTTPAMAPGAITSDQPATVMATPTPTSTRTAPPATGASDQRQTDVTLSTVNAPAVERQPDQPTVQSARPDYAYNPQPDYPTLLREHGIGGVVWLRVWVESDGRPADIQVTRGSGYRLMDESALRAVKQWRFIPALQGTQHVASWVEFPIRFTLNS